MKIKSLFNFKIFAPIIFAVTILVISRYFFNNQYFQVHDWTAGARIFELHNSLKDGHFPLRWSKNFGFGFGMPLFQFYSPLAFFITELFLLLNFSILASLKVTYIAISIFGFFGTYLLAKKLTNKWGGLLSAVAFSLAPYHAVNIFVRGSLAEFLAISFMPWTIYYLLKFLDHKKHYLGLTLALTGFLLSHNVSILTYLPFFFLITIIILVTKKETKKIPIILLSLFHAIALSAWFLIPAFTQKSFTRADDLVGGFSYFAVHFLYLRQLFIPDWGYGGSIGGLEDDMSFYLGNEIVFFSGLAGIFILTSVILKVTRSSQYSGSLLSKIKVIISKLLKDKNFKIYFSLGLLLVISLLLTSYKSQFLWQFLPLISFVQFPWRFLGISSFLLSILVAYLALTKKKKLFSIVAIFLIIGFNFRFFKPQELKDLGEMYDPDVTYIQEVQSGVLPDYLPKDIDWSSVKPSDVSLSIEEGEGEIKIIKDKTQIIQAKLNLDTDILLKIHRFTFPNWQIKLDNNKLETCKIENFVYECRITAGEYDFKFYWSEIGINLISNILSIFSLGVLVYIYKKQINIKH
jgi:6-pyruvoyl-tetrahydropterin synthase-like protein